MEAQERGATRPFTAYTHGREFPHAPPQTSSRPEVGRPVPEARDLRRVELADDAARLRVIVLTKGRVLRRVVHRAHGRVIERVAIRDAPQPTHARLQLRPAALEVLEPEDVAHKQRAALVHQPRELRRVQPVRVLVAVRVGRREAPRVGRLGPVRAVRVAYPRAEVEDRVALVGLGRQPLLARQVAAVQRVLAVDVEYPVRDEPRPRVAHQRESEGAVPRVSERALPKLRGRVVPAHARTDGARSRLLGAVQRRQQLLVRKEFERALHE
eukprot:1786190-Prymnesium_polylepis.2